MRDTAKNTIINVFINDYNGHVYRHIWNRVRMHSLTVYFDNGFYFHDTGETQNDRQLSKDWWNFAQIGDILIYWVK